MKKIIVTGGAGFIGSHLVKKINELHPEWVVHVFDKFSYAANRKNLIDCKYHMHFNDITDTAWFDYWEKKDIDAIFHLAAETHVDNSIKDPLVFAKTNVLGTVNMLELGRAYHSRNPKFVFHHISTDEVFGSLSTIGKFDEDSPYDPKSPYSASKASGDHFVRAYGNTYKLPYVITNCSNNYGTHQHAEKLIPTVLRSLHTKTPIPVYGTGGNVRDWLHVEDHAEAILKAYNSANRNITYCIGGNCEISNIDLIHLICDAWEETYGEKLHHLINFVKDRPGHDFRYAIDHELFTFHTGWRPKRDIRSSLKEIIYWYVENFNTSAVYNH